MGAPSALCMWFVLFGLAAAGSLDFFQGLRGPVEVKKEEKASPSKMALPEHMRKSGQEKERGPGPWRIGRGTYYGDEHWAWSIHEGSCGYGNIWEDEPMGWDVAAIPDVHYEFAGSCGTCYEVACNKMGFKDNYGNHLDRNNVCRDDSQSVVVRITDTCPCNYATNSYSNKRWCCGDMDHFDLSIWAFEKLADTKWGVIGLKYRPVSCDYKPGNPAPKPDHSFHAPPPSTPRPWWLPKTKNEKGQDMPPPPPVLPTQAVAPKSIYSGGVDSKWFTKEWNSKRTYGWKGPSGKDAYCAELYGYGAFGFESFGGDFSNRVSMEVWFRTSEGVPDVRLQLTGHKECGLLKLKDLQPTGEQIDGYSRYLIYLGLFDFGAHDKRVMAFASDFRGCGGNSAGEVKNLYIRNDGWHQQFVCMDKLTLL